MYVSAEELISRHWEVDCKGFILKCDTCKTDITEGHNCVAVLLKEKHDFMQKIRKVEDEVRGLKRRVEHGFKPDNENAEEGELEQVLQKGAK